jgi:hypothetical protein
MARETRPTKELTGIVVEGVFGALVFMVHGKIKALIAKLEAMP